MKKKIFYWSPCLDRVGTVISTINSAISLSRYDKYNDVRIINVCGEWDQYRKMLKDNSVNLIDFKFKYFKILPKKGFIRSRFSYIIIYLLSFFPLFFLLKKEKPDKIILHLITSLPLTLLNLFKFNTDFILRISGYPKLNIMRKFFWRLSSKKINIVTFPTLDLKKDLENLNLFDRGKLHYLPDAIIKIENLKKKVDLPTEFNLIKNKKVILSVGRLTKQKNFSYLINEFSEFLKINDDFVLFILGEGEDKKKLSQLIENKGLKEKIFLLGFKKNVYNFMKNSEIFVLSSLWEEVGFVMIEAAICNTFIISSDCPNGPKEFLNYGKNGIMFKSNSKDSLLKSLINYSSLNKEKVFADKVILKKKTSKHTMFKHYLTLNKLLEL
mgnify:FL=1|tara:strand:+ start:770 stop:1918 length:1149 start_codon:yes stop_codon:yes gene_type:complete